MRPNDSENSLVRLVGDLAPGEAPSEGRLALERLPGFVTIWAPLLRQALVQIQSIPEALRRQMDVSQVPGLDRLWDKLHKAIGLALRAIIVSPQVDEDTRAAAVEAEATLALDPAQRRLPFADEAAMADNIRRRAEACKPALERLQAPGPPGATLYDWVQALARLSDQLNMLLGQRAEQPSASRANAGRLRNECIGLINRARGALSDELTLHPELPQDLVDIGFRYWDHLVAQRKSLKPKTPARPPVTGPVAAPLAEPVA